MLFAMAMLSRAPCGGLQVLVPDIENPIAVAASSTLVAVAQVTAALARVLVYDTGGTLVTTIGGARLREGDLCCAGVRLGLPSSVSVSCSGRCDSGRGCEQGQSRAGRGQLKWPGNSFTCQWLAEMGRLFRNSAVQLSRGLRMGGSVPNRCNVWTARTGWAGLKPEGISAPTARYSCAPQYVCVLASSCPLL